MPAKRLFSRFSQKQIFITGFVLVLLSQLPFWILGERSVIPYHDQLDGEMIGYIYQAKYLFSGNGLIPEFLNGASKTSLCPPAPFAVLFFRLLPPFAAYLLLQLLGQLTAYTGMFLLAGLLTESSPVSLITALLYAFLPFLPVYGLSQYGMPMLLYCICLLYQRRRRKLCLLYLAFYAMMSSLVLCGFIWLGFLTAANIFLWIKGKGKEKTALTGGLFLMLGVYLAENLPLLSQLFFSGGEISHRSEFVLAAVPFADSLKTFFLQNEQHCRDNHIWILALSVFVLFTGIFLRGHLEARTARLLRLLAGDLLLIFLLCGVSAFWNSLAGVLLRNRLGSLGSFQLERVLWTAPLLWYTALAMCLRVLPKLRREWKVPACALGFAFLAILSFHNLKMTFVKPCIQNLLMPGYNTMSYSDYYAIGILEQAEEYIRTAEGLEKDEYKVASLGIEPAAALYHGFYCVDGYSNNYSLSYKHAFREVIAPELALNDWIRVYFDTWGNRCYLTSHETGGSCQLQKDSFVFRELRIDTRALARLGCDYIFSAAYIENAEEAGLKLLREEPFQTPDSYYGIYLYKIQDSSISPR